MGYKLIKPLHLSVLSNVVSLSYCLQHHVGKGQHEATIIDSYVIIYIHAVILLLLLLHMYAVQVLRIHAVQFPTPVSMSHT